jgi:mycothiol synthase
MSTDNSQWSADLEVSRQLTGTDASAALDLAQRATLADGVGPLSDHVVLHLRHGGEAAARDFLLRRADDLAGYGHLDPADPVDGASGEGASGEMVIDPALRRHGLGHALVRAMIAEAGHHDLRLWAHGDQPAATRLAAATGFRRTRSLWQMHRPLGRPVDEPQHADGITVRAFQAGRDEDAWTELNHQAFAHHPEQGGWTRADLELRELESWFDPAGFFLAERDGRLVGFHWTKIHDATAGKEAVGEVYVIGVDAGERGSGLGRALTLIGLRYLRDRGLGRVMLYVDETNTSAIRLYESLGFEHTATDVMFTRAAG